jgi:hypothetical protein
MSTSNAFRLSVRRDIGFDNPSVERDLDLNKTLLKISMRTTLRKRLRGCMKQRKIEYAVIKLNYLFESLNKIGLVKRLDAQLRLWVNAGTVNVTVSNPDATNCGYNLNPAEIPSVISAQ